MNETLDRTRGGMGPATVLTAVFVVLKLTGTVDWAWKWVLAPLWISAALAALLLTVFAALIVFSKKGWK